MDNSNINNINNGNNCNNSTNNTMPMPMSSMPMPMPMDGGSISNPHDANLNGSISNPPSTNANLNSSHHDLVDFTNNQNSSHHDLDFFCGDFQLFSDNFEYESYDSTGGGGGGGGSNVHNINNTTLLSPCTLMDFGYKLKKPFEGYKDLSTEAPRTSKKRMKAYWREMKRQGRNVDMHNNRLKRDEYTKKWRDD